MNLYPQIDLTSVLQAGGFDFEGDKKYNGPNVTLWFVVEIGKKNFSEKIDYNEELGLLLASDGRFIGVARSLTELEEMTTAKSREVEVVDKPKDGESKSTVHIETVTDNVYLTYKAEVRGTEGLEKLLAFLLAEEMLKPQNN